MARLIRAQTADGVTIIEFLDDVMQDRTDGFKTHHRIAAAKELIVHIIRDEQPAHTPSPSTRETDKRGDSTAVGADPCVRPLPGSKTPSPSTGEGGACPESPRRSEGDTSVVPAEAGTQGGGGGRSTAANPTRTEPALSTAEGSAHPNPSSSVVPANTIVVPAKAGTHPSDPEPGSQLETKNSKLKTLPARRPRTRRTRTQRRRDGNARAAILAERGPSATASKGTKNPHPWSSPSPSVESRKNSNSTGTSRTPIARPSTPHTQAAHPPGDRPDYNSLVVGTKIEVRRPHRHTGESRYPVPGCCRQLGLAAAEPFPSLGVPVATGMGGSREVPAP